VKGGWPPPAREISSDMALDNAVIINPAWIPQSAPRLDVSTPEVLQSRILRRVILIARSPLQTSN